MTDTATHHRGPEAGACRDTDREAAAARVAQQASTGSLTLDEYADRAAAIEQAATGAELDAAVRGLPERTGAAPPHHRGRWLVAVFGGTDQRGRWRLSSHLRIVAVLGGATLDLGQAEPEAPESVITVIAVLGGVEMIAPPGVPIAFSGLSVLGGRTDERTGGPPLPGAPLIRVRTFTLLGGVKVRQRDGRRNLMDVIRARVSRGDRPGTDQPTG